MYNLKALFVCVCVCVSLSSFAQVTIFDCGVDEANFPAGYFEYNPTNQPFDNRPYVFKIHFYQVNKDNGSNINPKSELDVLKGLALLNQVYNQFNIFFKWDGYDQINSSEFHEHQPGNPSWGVDFDLFLTDPNNNYYVPQSFNVYIVKDLNPGLVGTGSQFWMNAAMNIKIVSDWFNHRALAHEAGHILGLKHTFGQYEEYGQTNCEHVTRDTESEGFNAYEKGDKLLQTNATPFRNTYEGVELDIDCNYLVTSTAVDCEGTPYVDPEFKNIMSYTRIDCFRELKLAQGESARWRIRNRFLVDLNHVLDTIHREELYKPYKGEYYVSGPSTSSNPPLFQIGFDYEFVDCGDTNQVYNEPSDYDDTSFSYGGALVYYNDDHIVDDIEHINHTAIRILQIDSNQPRKCYNNFNFSAIGGSLTRFIDGTPNNNVVITPKDSTAINDANLIPNLDPGLYNIKTNYNDGTTKEVLILRVNNN